MKGLILFYQLWFAYINALSGFPNVGKVIPKFEAIAKAEPFYKKFTRRKK